MFLNSFGARRLRLEGEDAARFPHPPRRMQGRHPDVGASVNKDIVRLEHRAERQLVLEVVIAAEEINASFPVVAQVEFHQVAMYFPRIVRFGAAPAGVHVIDAADAEQVDQLSPTEEALA